MFHPLVKPEEQHYSSNQIQRTPLFTRTLEIMNIAKSVRTRANLRELLAYFRSEQKPFMNWFGTTDEVQICNYLNSINVVKRPP